MIPCQCTDVDIVRKPRLVRVNAGLVARVFNRSAEGRDIRGSLGDADAVASSARPFDINENREADMIAGCQLHGHGSLFHSFRLIRRLREDINADADACRGSAGSISRKRGVTDQRAGRRAPVSRADNRVRDARARDLAPVDLTVPRGNIDAEPAVAAV